MPADELHQLAVTVARMEGKLDAIITANTDHEARLRSLERWRWLMTGGASLIGGGAGAAIASLFR